MEKFIDELFGNFKLQFLFFIFITIFIIVFVYYVFKYRTQIKNIFLFFDKIGEVELDQKKIIDNQELLMQQHKVITENVDKIAKEAIPNGSNTLRKTNDSIFKIEKLVEEICHRLDSRFEIDKFPLFECDSDGLCVNANSALCDLFGVSKDRIFGLGWTTFIHQRDVDVAIKNWNRAVHNKHTELVDSYRIINYKTNETIPVTYKAIFKHNSDGTLKSVLGTIWKTKTVNTKREEDIKCLLEMVDKFKKTKVGRDFLEEIENGK
jgi:PAS domain-containing protein